MDIHVVVVAAWALERVSVHSCSMLAPIQSTVVWYRPRWTISIVDGESWRWGLPISSRYSLIRRRNGGWQRRNFSTWRTSNERVHQIRKTCRIVGLCNDRIHGKRCIQADIGLGYWVLLRAGKPIVPASAWIGDTRSVTDPHAIAGWRRGFFLIRRKNNSDSLLSVKTCHTRKYIQNLRSVLLTWAPG